MGGVDRGSAAEADQAVEVALAEGFDACLDHCIDWFRDRIAEHRGCNPRSVQRIEASFHQSGFHHERIGHDQRTRKAEFAQNLGDLFHRPAGNQQ